ncbi:Ferredoxin, partial [Dysosmobacter welbionis]
APALRYSGRARRWRAMARSAASRYRKGSWALRRRIVARSCCFSSSIVMAGDPPLSLDGPRR